MANIKLFKVIKSDLYRYEKGYTIKNFIHAYFVYEGFKFSVWLRLCSFFNQWRMTKYTILPILVLIYRYYKHKYGYDIPYQIPIGTGLLIFHFGGIVISAKSIGKNFTVSQNVTVGMKIVNGHKRFPIIGNNVYLAPGCAVIGDITIGDFCAIGTNSVVTKNMPPKSVIIGIPGRIISNNGANEYLNNIKEDNK